MPLRPGDKIDRYAIVALLGSGGMGEVYRAFDARLERQVALKVLTAGSRGPAGDPAGPMLREARAAAALEHPNIVAVYDVAEATSPASLSGAMYLTMELVEGRSLRAAVGDATVPIPRRVEWLASIARALDAAHRRGLVHRDIKPGNVMIRADGVVKVLDFGIAKRLERPIDANAVTQGTGDSSDLGASILAEPMTTRGDAAGTPAYMAPEQIRNEPLDGRCDQFAWGVLAYELLCGRRPWRSEGDTLHLVAEVLSFDPPEPSALEPRVSSHVSSVVKRALSKSAEERFASMSDVLAALEQRDARRRRLTLGAPVLAGLAVASALAVGAVRKRDSPTLTAPSPARECDASAACMDTHAGAPWACIAKDGRCAPLASDDCEVLAEPADLRDPATVWIGLMWSGYPATRNGAELARRDFALVPRSLPGASARRRPIALVSCSDAREPRRALRHLLDDVGVPAVIGFHSSEEALDLLSEDLAPRGILSVVAMNPAAQLGAVASPAGFPRLVWRTTNDTTQTAGAASAFVERVIEPRVHAHQKGPLNVALLRPANITGVAFSDAIVSSLRLNGGSVADNQLHFAEFVFDPAATKADPHVVAAESSLAAMRPDVILYFGAELFDLVLAPLERGWPPALPRPTYVSGLPFDDDVLREVSDDALRRRMFAVSTPANTSVNAKFTLHYNATFPDKVTPADSPNTTYDAFYVIAYALYSAGNGPVTGAALAAQIGHLVAGSKIEVGPAKILDALSALESGGSIDLDGAASALDFDLATGESRPDHVVLCVARAADGSRVGVESGLSWSAKSGVLSGKMGCE